MKAAGLIVVQVLAEGEHGQLWGSLYTDPGSLSKADAAVTSTMLTKQVPVGVGY